jgi:dihydroflavonol-4-reductase
VSDPASPGEAPRSHYLVTGASGFLGRHLLESCAAHAQADRILALVRDADAWREYDWTAPLAGIRLLKGSATDAAGFERELPPLRGIYHLAALVRHSRRQPEDVIRTNVEGGLQMVRLAARHRCRLVLLSTSGAVGCFRDPEASADERAPYCDAAVADWPYYRSKIELERRARALASELGVEMVTIRPPVLLGPGDHRFRSTAVVLRALRGGLPFLIRGGVHFADVRDAAQAIRRAMLLSGARPVYHLDGMACGVEEFFAMIEQVSGVAAPRRVLPFGLAWIAASAAERLGVWLRGEPFAALPDPVVIEMASRYWGLRSLYAAAELGYKCREPRETLRDTVAWLRANHEALAAPAAHN